LDSKAGLLERYEIFAGAAVIAAHANNIAAGFRLRDVRFLIELFSNWLEASQGEAVLPLQNTQVSRYVTSLVDEGLARRINRKGRPIYRLTRVGLIELIDRITTAPYIGRKELFFFLYYFIENYRPKLTELVAREGRQFPVALKLELEALLNTDAVLNRELADAERELQKLDDGIYAARQSSAIAIRMNRAGRPIEDIAAELEHSHPYELNSQKPLSQLLGEIPPEIRLWELETGNLRRVEQIFRPSRAMLCCYINELKALGRSKNGGKE
jgi:hypothetical protein